MQRSINTLVSLGLLFTAMALWGQDAAPAKTTQPDLTIHDIEAALDESIDLAPFRQEMKLKDAFALLNKVLGKRNKTLPIHIDANSFKEEDPDADEIEDTQVQIKSRLQALKVRQLLRDLTGQVRTNNANFVAKPGLVQITTHNRSDVGSLLSERIAIRFQGRPLHLALDDLYEQTGVSVVLDSRVGILARTPITARFREISLGDALLLMSEIANLKLLTKEQGNVIFITTPAHAQRFIWERMMNPYNLPYWRNGIGVKRAEAA